jgi:hypothetical protein
MTKSIGYAYPTSTNAVKFMRPDGCYYVQLEDEGKPASNSRPCDMVKEAETLADSYLVPWSDMYKRYPFRGSRFSHD